MDVDDAEVDTGNAAAAVRPAVTPVQTHAASYANWASSSAATARASIQVVDKTAQTLKRKSDALQDPSSKKYGSLVNGLRAYKEQHGPGPSSPKSPAAAAAPQLPSRPFGTRPQHGRSLSASSSSFLSATSPSSGAASPLPATPAPVQSTPAQTLVPNASTVPSTPTSGPREPGVAVGHDNLETTQAAFTTRSQRALEQAAMRLQARLFVIDAFPDPFALAGFIKEAWADFMAADKTDPIRLSSSAQTNLTKRQFTLRTRYKPEIIARVRELYQLSTLAGTELKNRIDQLKDGDVFIYERTVPRSARAGKSADDDAEDGEAEPEPGADQGETDQDGSGKVGEPKKFVELVGKSRAFTHPAVRAVVIILGFERKARSKTPQLTALLPDAFADGIPYRLYAYACTMIHHAFDCILKDTTFTMTTYKPIYSYWVDTVTALFNPVNVRKKAKVDELRAQHWGTIRNTYRISLIDASTPAHAVSRHEEALDTSDEEE